MRIQDLDEAVGRIVKGVNTTVDVGPGEIKTQAAKFGNAVDKDGRPPSMSKRVKGKSTNVLYNLGLAEGVYYSKDILIESVIYEGFLDSAKQFLGNKINQTAADIKGAVVDLKSAGVLIKDIVTNEEYLNKVNQQLKKQNTNLIKQINRLTSENQVIANVWNRIKNLVLNFINTTGWKGFLGRLGVYGFLRFIVVNTQSLQDTIIDTLIEKLTDLSNILLSATMGGFLELFNSLTTVKKYFFDILTSIKKKLDFSANLQTNSKYTSYELALLEGGHTLEETTLGPKKPGKLFTALSNEAFDTEVEWVKEPGPSGSTVYAAKVDDAYIEITYKPTEKGVYISFTRGARMSVTGEGSQNKIFGAVINHIKQWVAKNKPEQIVFSAFKPRTGAFGSQDTTRSGLYRKMVQRFASQNGYDYDVEDTGNEDTFILTRRQNESLEEDIAWQNSVSKHIFDFKSNEFTPASKNFLLPISSSILKNIKANPVRATVFHVTGYDNLDAMIKNQGTKKAISTFFDMDTSVFASGVQGGSGLVFELDANVLISDSRDLDSKVDNSGRRWIKMKYMARNTRNFNTSDLYEDVPQLLSNLLKKYTNKTYNPYMEEAVYDAWKELGTTLNSTGDGKTLNLLIKDFMDGIYKIYQTHKEDLIKMLRHHLTQRTIGSDLNSWDEIVVNEYKIKKIHVLDSVTLKKNPQVMDRVKSTGIKYDVWNNDSQLGSYIRKIADKEKAELGESFSESKLTYSTPNFEHEWEEAERYPEFRKIGKAAWIELAKKGRAVTIKSAKGINNTDAADPNSFKSLDSAKQKRALAQLKKGEVEMPIVAVYSDGWKELVGGNTRLTAMLAQNKKAKVWVFKVPDEVAELAEMYNEA